MLDPCRGKRGRAVQDLVGQSFHLDDRHYQIVAVRNLAGDVLVYAESDQAEAASNAPGPRRAAFHYADIKPLLDRSRIA